MKKILLIEDDANLAFMLKDGLESEGFNVFHITNAEEVVETMDDFMLHVPDLILLDVNLKGAIDGFELSKKIRQKSQIPIIFTTARTQIEDLQQGFSIGNVDYMKKPFGIRELVLHINEMISRSQHTLPQRKDYCRSSCHIKREPLPSPFFSFQSYLHCGFGIGGPGYALV